MRAVESRRPCSSVITTSWVTRVPPRWTAVAVPVTRPERTARWCVALISTPTTLRSGPAWIFAAIEPRDSASTRWAPPCSSPTGCSLPATGRVATARSAVSSRKRRPIFWARGLIAAPPSAATSSGVRPASAQAAASSAGLSSGVTPGRYTRSEAAGVVAVCSLMSTRLAHATGAPRAARREET